MTSEHFDARQLRCLRAVVDSIIPPDDFPGGWAAGVGGYLLHQLGSDLADELESYRLWLDELDREALAAAGMVFAGLDPDARAALLQALERNQQTTDWAIDPAATFARIVEHCTEGFYSDPGNGGNRAGVSWRMIGFEVTA